MTYTQATIAERLLIQVVCDVQL